MKNPKLLVWEIARWVIPIMMLAKVRSLTDAIMPDGRKYEEWKAEGRLDLEAEVE